MATITLDTAATQHSATHTQHEIDIDTTVDHHVNEICRLAEQCIGRHASEPTDKYDHQITFHEDALLKLGLCKGEIYSFINQRDAEDEQPRSRNND